MGKKESIQSLKNYKQKCRERNIKFFIANDFQLLNKIQADGFYISANNNDLSLIIISKKVPTIGSAHNLREINFKARQGCSKLIFSRLFKTDYLYKETFLGIVKFNLFSININKEIIPLGGIRSNNLNLLKIVKSNSFCILSAIKKKPANIINRLF